jgi:hypothetical protein
MQMEQKKDSSSKSDNIKTIKNALSESNIFESRGKILAPPQTRVTSPKLMSFMQEFVNEPYEYGRKSHPASIHVM